MRIRDFIETCWRSEGGRINPTIDDMICWRKNETHMLDETQDWLLIFDEIASVISLYTTICARTLFDGATTEQNCALSLCSSISSLSMSFRQSITQGIDVSARHLARSIREYTDVLWLIRLQPSLADELSKCANEEQCNHFWHKHVSKGKARKRLIQFSHSLSDGNSLFDWMEQEDKALAMASHPSYAAGMIPFLHNIDDPSAIVGLVDFLYCPENRATIRPLRYATITLFQVLNAMPSLAERSVQNEEAIIFQQTLREIEKAKRVSFTVIAHALNSLQETDTPHIQT